MRSSARPPAATEAGLAISRAVLLALYEKMMLLRRFETAAQTACRKGETPGFLHLYIGEEATAVGVCAHLRSSDWITSTHLGHGHALAKGMAPTVLMAELYGKRDGCCGGRGGTEVTVIDPVGNRITFAEPDQAREAASAHAAT